MRTLEELKNKNIYIYPIKQLVLTKQKNYNLDRIKSLSDLNAGLVYKTVVSTLEILDTKETKHKELISEVLLWMDVAKAGTKDDIVEWKKLGFNLFTHNLGSAEIYKKYSSNFNEIVYILIKTHGLIGQYIKGEVNLDSNKELYYLVRDNKISKSDLREILLILNECIIREVSSKIYEKEESQIEHIIDRILNNDFNEKIDIVNRIDMLNYGISDDDKILIENAIKDPRVKEQIELVFKKTQLWYYASSLISFDVIKQLKILLIISNYIEGISEITFSPLMMSIYLNYKKIKRINIYKQRIIENYLDEISFEQIINKEIINNINISYSIVKNKTTLEFNFIFSKVAKKLIEFCEVAYESNNLYNKSVILLYDLFGFRKDNYDVL